ncbi:putative mucin TcMUCII [Trypanosoma cruzi]|uniref:Mucin TcMUCII, putative n=2 Tax=Trypanosoma cruzi TaxID=5693 RepID=Q4DU44_TRYCC|nr:mucin TcMUCII, putative [Trypanosoma cruzi]EAN96055.1 mucin TcMUCII, putative [Trypanosoma cruzi]PWV06202.1 putative mucin TcMUCII [Trypanosoma cruzi]RNC51555.1 mucin TcMUCII [Trypanosoma cruzi]|eukprot:XP_817906.1 mucin TcMUCII [Trypanosoma cruzi strain CL Brener]
MMTCRLLCALLVLALCCCPSVCVAADGEKNVDVPGQPPVQPGVQTPSSKQLQSGASGVAGSQSNSDVTQGQNQVTGGGGSQNSLPSPPAPTGESATSGTKGSTDPEAGRSKEPDAVTGAGVLQIQPRDAESPDSRTVTAPSTATTGMSPTPPNELENNSAKRITAPTTTTTTAEAPATTTTTTTQAPSDTSTEAPTTTTTRAPSRLREIDGSLSSSAWVCAPLLLAVSALAYTTLG